MLENFKVNKNVNYKLTYIHNIHLYIYCIINLVLFSSLTFNQYSIEINCKSKPVFKVLCINMYIIFISACLLNTIFS